MTLLSLATHSISIVLRKWLAATHAVNVRAPDRPRRARRLVAENVFAETSAGSVRGGDSVLVAWTRETLQAASPARWQSLRRCTRPSSDEADRRQRAARHDHAAKCRAFATSGCPATTGVVLADLGWTYIGIAARPFVRRSANAIYFFRIAHRCAGHVRRRTGWLSGRLRRQQRHCISVARDKYIDQASDEISAMGSCEIGNSGKRLLGREACSTTRQT